MGGGSQSIEAGGLRIHYERRGSGPPLVLLHGGLSDSREWRRQIEELSGEFTVVAWDAPGCGRSEDPAPDLRLPGYADCLAELIGGLGLERPHVAGLSFGAGLALEFSRRHPGVPRSLVLVSGYAGWAGSLPKVLVEDRLRQLLADAERPLEQAVPGWVAGLLTDDAPEQLREELSEIMRDGHPAGMRAMAHSFAEADLREVLGRIDVPTLLVYGSLDVRSPPAVGEELAALIPGSRLVVIEGAGHQLNMEAPERFNAVLGEFLAAQAA